MTHRVLIIDDEKVLNGLIADTLREVGFDARSAYTWREGKALLERSEPDVVLLDVALPDARGDELLPELAARVPVVILTAYGSVPQAVQAIRNGASDYLTKPVEPEELELVLRRVIETETLREGYRYCRRQLDRQKGTALVGDSPALRQVLELVDAVAPTDMTVLIHGESGVGKELLAHEVHARSGRARHPFVAIDCCTIQENLFESELFGHEKGAFTGAERRKKGLIEMAEGGTLFLDEIGEIGPAIQAKLLRVLETGRFRRVGSTEDLHANVRIVAATNRDLAQMVKDGRFRQDLFYRLNAFTITMPPLRERREDIPLLARHFIANHNFSRRINKRLAKATLRQLVAYDWPGNVRELRNVIERAIILSRQQREIRPEHLAFCGGNAPAVSSGVTLQFEREPTLDEVEQRYLELLLDKYSGHRSKVARAMGVSERNIYRLIEKYGLKGRRLADA